MRYRTGTEIDGDILNYCQQYNTKTRLMYLAFLSYTQTNTHIDKLLEKKLLSEENKRYLITEKGRVLLEHLQEAKRILN